MICRICQEGFTPQHFNQKLCSLDCKTESVRQTKAKYKKTEKGIESEKRWRENPKKKEIDKKWRRSEKGKMWGRMNVKKHPTSKNEKARLARLYRITRLNKTGKYRKWWIEKKKDGCNKCGSFERLEIDHIIPRARGGGDELSNLQILCKECNGIKNYNRKRESKIWQSNVKNVVRS